jgi:hypothetical protein
LGGTRRVAGAGCCLTPVDGRLAVGCGRDDEPLDEDDDDGRDELDDEDDDDRDEDDDEDTEPPRLPPLLLTPAASTVGTTTSASNAARVRHLRMGLLPLLLKSVELLERGT